MTKVLALVAVLSVYLWSLPGFAEHIRRENAFAGLRDGMFGDGGVNTYVSARGRIQTVYRYDANNDDIADVFSPNHDILLVTATATTENEYHPDYIYRGNNKDLYSPVHHLELPGLKSQ